MELVFALHTIANILIGFSRKKEVLHLLETVASLFGVVYFFMSNRPITVLLFIFALINIISKFRTSFRGFFKVFWPLLVLGFYYLCYKLYQCPSRKTPSFMAGMDSDQVHILGGQGAENPRVRKNN